ncbi:MAG TPA: Gfo/Idh/MocA family oxidoreductase [Candidatus Limnocylindrales bacterium]|nr:Gfo/Idh/MocA family oxidoreductase [Candidatus Limnocylindrales bacterium]
MSAGGAGGRAKPIGFGLIGAGAISTQHLEALDAIPGARIAAIASASSDKAKAAGERWGVPWTTNIDELLARADVDAVSIATPSGLHPGEALAALRHGKHVLVEKPIALSNAGARQVVEEAKRRGLVAGTVSQRRFEPTVRAVRDAVTGGALGKVAMVVAEGFYFRPQSYYDSAPWRGTIELDGGVLMNQAIHTIDLLRWIGGPVDRVSANVATIGHQMEAEDTASVSLRFASGALGAILATTCAATELPTELRIHGERGLIRLVGEDVAEWEVPDRAKPPADAKAGADGVAAATATWGTNAVGYVRQYTDFIAAIRDGHAPAVTAEDGAAAVEIVLAAYQSSRTGAAVELTGGRT